MNIGMDMVEGTANVLNLSSNNPARAIGFIMERVRGVENKLIFLSGLKEDRQIFGGVDASMYSPYVMANYFQNLEGNYVPTYGIRIVGTGTDAATGNVVEATKVIAGFTAGYQGEQDKGDWGNNLVVKLYPKEVTGGMTDYFLMEVYESSQLVESLYDSTLALLEAKVNSVSKYVVMNEGADGYASPFTAVGTATLTGGTYVAPVEGDFEPAYTGDTPEGMAIFAGSPVTIFACPEFFTSTLAVKAEVFAKANDKYFVMNAAQDITGTDLETLHNAVKSATISSMGKYLEWVKVSDENSGYTWIPGIGYFLGAGFGRACIKDGGYVWSVPAGENTYPVGIYEFSHIDLTEITKKRYVTEFLTNVVMYNSILGYYMYSSRTCSTAELYHSAHVRLETNWIKLSLKDRNAKFHQKLNTPKLRKDMYIDSIMFFKNLYNQGGIEGSVPFSSAVVITVATDSVNRKQINEDISWIPPETVEYQKIALNRNDGVLNIL